MKFFNFYSILFGAALTAASFCLSSCKDDDKDDNSNEAIFQRNKEAGENFLLQNRKNDGVVETYSGLQFRIDSLGAGDKPLATDSVTIDYIGTLYNGTEFVATTSTLCVEDQIFGMQEGLQRMPEGSVFDLWIPYYLAYGSIAKSYFHNGKTVSITAYSMLHYHVRLAKVKHNLYD